MRIYANVTSDGVRSGDFSKARESLYVISALPVKVFFSLGSLSVHKAHGGEDLPRTDKTEVVPIVVL